MPKYEITSTVVYTYEVEVDNHDDAIEMGYKYEDYPQWGELHSVEVASLDEEDEEEEE